MDYMREINAFYDWLAINPQITDSARNLWHALMHTANRAGWITEFTVAISTLEAKTGMSRAALYRARNVLQQAKRISFAKRGGNLCATYTIFPLVSQYETQNETHTGHTAQHEPDTPREHYSSYPTDTRKTKTKTNTKEAATTRFEAYRAAVEARAFSGAMHACVMDWLMYKTERRDKYTDTGLSKLLGIFERKAAEYGEDAVIYAVDQAITNCWKGIVWDKAPGGARPSADANYVSCDDEEV